MRLVRIEAHDFMQLGDLDLNLASLYAAGVAQAVIVGANGSGKSALMDAVLWSVYGRGTDRAETTDGLIRFDRLGMWVRTTWLRGEQTVVIRRDRSIETKAGESMLSLTVDGESRKQHTMGETQVEIVTLIGLERDQLLAGPFMEQGESDKLMRYDPAPRKALFSALCGLDRFVPWYDRSKAWLATAVAELAAIEVQIPPARVRADREMAAHRELNTAIELEDGAQAAMTELTEAMTALTGEGQALREQALRAEHLSEELLRLNRQVEAEAKSQEKARAAAVALEVAVAVDLVEPVDEPLPERPDMSGLAALEETAVRVEPARTGVAQMAAELAHSRHAHEKAAVEGLCDHCPYRGKELTAEADARLEARHAQGLVWLSAHGDDPALVATMKERASQWEASSRLIGQTNDARHEAWETASRRRLEDRSRLAELRSALVESDGLRAGWTTEAAAVQAERLRLIQTQDRALEVVDELRQKTEQYEVSKRLWATAAANRALAASVIADVDAAKVELAALDVAWTEKASERDTLERTTAMFHRDGLPTLLLELMIPLVEARANELLVRMPGELNIALVTQRQTKKGSWTDTLDVDVSKRGRPLAYGMASGAERFRIDLALRLGLAGVLLHRTGAQFETLWLDEPFAAQDDTALEALLQSVAAVVDEFGLTLVVTHQREVAERIPVRIEVTETALQTALVTLVAA